jgi:hypothetical protein
VFYGFDGMKVVHTKEMKKYSRDALLYVVGLLARERYPRQVEDFFESTVWKERERTKVKTRKILDESARKERKVHEKHAKVRYLSYHSVVVLTVIDDLSIIGIYTKDPIFISIESKEVADNFLANCEVLWRMAKE